MTTKEWALEKLKEEPALALSLGYLVLTLIGLTYQWALLDKFGVNVLDWAEFSDFVFASIREPVVMLLCIPAYGVLLTALRWEQKTRQNQRYVALFESRPWQTLLGMILRILVMPCYFFAFTNFFALTITKGIKAGTAQRVTIEYNTNVPGAKPALSTGPKPLWIGATSRAVFLYDESKKETVIVPQGSIARIFVEPRTKKKP